MNHFELQGGELTCEDVPLAKIAEAVGTPVYVYSSATLERHFTVLRDALVGAGLKELNLTERASPRSGAHHHTNGAVGGGMNIPPLAIHAVPNGEKGR